MLSTEQTGRYFSAETASGKRGVALWAAQALLYLLPVAPVTMFYIFFAAYIQVSALMFVGFFLLLSCVAATGLSAQENRSRSRLIVKVLLTLAFWIPALAMLSVFLYPFRITLAAIPLVMLVLLLCRLEKRPERRNLLEAGGVAAGVIVFYSLIAAFDPALTLAFALTVLLFVGLAWRLRRERHELLPRLLFWPLALFYLTFMFFLAHAYWVHQAAQRPHIVAQPGVRAVEVGDDLDGDINSFFIDRDHVFMIPHHRPRIDHFRPDGRREELPLNGHPGNDIVLDRPRQKLYFTVGFDVFQVNLDDRPTIDLLRALSEELAIRAFHSAKTLAGYPIAAPDRLLIAFDTAPGFVTLDLTQHQLRMIPTSRHLFQSIWHPRGDKIISIALGLEKEPAKLLLLDLQGKILAQRDLATIWYTPAVTDEPYVFIADQFHNRLEKISADTLQTLASTATDAVPRVIAYLPAYRCVAVASFLSGTLTFYRADTLAPLTSIQVGRRVRALTPSWDGEELFVASAAGLFRVRLPDVLGDAEQ
mgnify:CR=1 FL=1